MVSAESNVYFYYDVTDLIYTYMPQKLRNAFLR